MDRAEYDPGGAPVVEVGRSAAASPLLVCAAIAGYALLAALARPLTAPAAVTVLLPGTMLLWAGARRPPRRTLVAGRTTASVWFGLGVVFCLWELGAFLSGNDDAHPTFSILSDPVLASYPGRVAGYLLWLTTGAWLVTR